MTLDEAVVYRIEKGLDQIIACDIDRTVGQQI
jgi:hypothetical protein